METVNGHNELRWGPAVGEISSEQDVLRYVLWRRLGSSGPWGDPLSSVSPGAETYIYRDFSAEPDVDYSYALSAQDCTPQYSPVSVSAAVHWSRNWCRSSARTGRASHSWWSF